MKMGQKNRPFVPLIITGTNSFYYQKDIFSKDNWKYLGNDIAVGPNILCMQSKRAAFSI